MISKKSKQIYLFFLFSLTAVACNTKNRVDVSDIKLDLKIERFDQDLSSLTPANLPTQAPILKKRYGAFYDDFMDKMINVGSTADTGYFANLRVVLANKGYKELKTSVEETFPNLEPQQSQLEDAFKHVLYYYPKQRIPKLISFFSGFAVQTPIGNDYIGIGLDMFLGANSKFYPSLRATLPGYITRRFTPENIMPRVMEAYIREDMFPEPEGNSSLLSKMIYNGKIMYMMDAVIPDVADSLKIGYTTQQNQWSRDFEAGIWGYFLEQNLLYETDYMKIQMYLTDAPFTPGIGERNESAPKLGVWAGWQIVKHYMDNNPSVTLQQLMNESDYQMILNKSKYKPK
ncbi:MAG: gldB [Sphingobacteriaceae bacterium]|jgi:gliding motility-associated lipoprotein GldB|nr:gldB [Sphingobacteriaceae bacterium]